jgi:hypothetical protein
VISQAYPGRARHTAPGRLECGHLRLRRRFTEPARCAIKVPGVADGVRRLAGGMARAYRYQAGPNLSSLAARPTERLAYNQRLSGQLGGIGIRRGLGSSGKLDLWSLFYQA